MNGKEEHRDAGIAHLIHALADGEHLTGEARAEYLDLLGTALAIRLALCCANRAAGKANTGHANARIARVVDYIAAHFSERLSIRELARLAHMSESHLKTQFREAMGTTIHRYIVDTRVQFALVELSSGRLPLSELADRAGFADQSHMTRWIKRIAGAAPQRLLPARSQGSYVRTAS